MTWFDLIILGILLVSTGLGVMRGLVREVFSLVLWVAGLWLASKLAGGAAVLFSPFIDTPSLRSIAAFIAVFLVIVISGNLLAHLLRHLLKKSGLSSVDRGLGGVFGVLRGLLLASTLVLLTQSTALARDPWWQRSHSPLLLAPLAHTLYNMLPEALAKHLRSHRATD